jgi:signal transduction histidine kinase/DNA-binding response OmpR family regulator
MFFGSVNGVAAFYPQDIDQNPIMPNTQITNFYFPGKESLEIDINEFSKNQNSNIVLTDSLILKPNNNDFRFDFSAMIFSSPEKIKYKYMLEGYNDDWIETDASNRFASFTNLSHGEYVFRVKSSNSDGIWEEKSRDMYIKIKTPFVHTWVAYITYFLILVLIIVYFANYSVMHYTTKKKIMLENDHNKRLHELDVLRTKFFINISHDLRTPLTLISGPLEKILQKSRIEPDTKYQLTIIQRNVKRLHYLIEQMLDIRKAEVGKLSVKAQNLDLVEFIRNEAGHFSLAIQNKGLSFSCTSDEEVMMAHFDPDIISKIIFNLLSNAIKYTTEGAIGIHISRLPATVDLSAENGAGGFIKVEVRDSGQGISAETQERIFDRFYQVEAKSGKGYGIGLSHCKDLIEALRGRIDVNSTPGVGSVFSFYIPNLETNDAQPQNSTTKETSLEDIYSVAGPEPANNEMHGKMASSGKSLLIVEDNADLRKYIRNELISVYKVYEANDGVQGLEMANQHLPDLIVSDIMMPNMDGIELCKQIKSNIETSHIPVILLTARVDNEKKYEGIEKGADDYIPKPFEMEYLKIRIKNLLRSREQLRELFRSTTSLEPSKITVTSVDEKFLDTLMKTIEKGIPDPDFNVNSLELEMGMSHANLYRKIKSITGFSGKEIIMHMRLARAHQVFTETKDIRISEVAYLVGFTNPKNFSRAFKEKYGKTPTDFLKE